MVNYDHYTYRVTWSVEDEEFVGLCAEYPSLSYLDQDRNAALEGITNLVKEVVADLQANGEAVPEPIAERTYSGKFQVRIPPELHRKLAIEAAEENVSLNRYVSHKLAS
ncbi:HicB family protein [Rippkaea orientalis PCC 8801]|uniref:HicB family protein n=1 Tax=Rippkaea orientalis (strain PCC 8801 / RF-1) TaxID=41431 RepID=B7K644_RIPO1|nr:type II toxin-antitoxin system HicB family antitoxin [Rippkaea orientalis]ACK68097.1 HicB family protein [Rippkaea orientalis PCC 8801]